MKKNNKIIFLVTIILIMSVVSVCFVGCTKDVKSEAFQLLGEALKNSKETNKYYVKTTITKGSSTTNYLVNYWGDDKDTTLVDPKVRFTIESSAGPLSNTEYKYYYYSPSLASDVDAKTAKDEDYKTYYFEQQDKKDDKGQVVFGKKEITLDEFFALDNIKEYTLNAILGSVENLSADNTEVISATTLGKVTNLLLNVKTKNNTADGSRDLSEYCNNKDENLAVSVRLINNRVARVAVVYLTDKNTIDDNKKEKFVCNVSYEGPRISIKEHIPAYDLAIDLA